MPYLFFILLFPVSIYCQEINLLPTIDREYVVFYDGLVNNTVLNKLTKKKYHKNCNIQQEETSFGFSRDYKPNMKKTYKYNFKGKLKKIYISYLIPEYNGYVKTFKVKLSYDRYGNITKQKSKNVYPTNKRSEYLLNSPYPNFRKKYTYNKEKQLVNQITKQLDNTAHLFIPSQKTNITWSQGYPTKITNYQNIDSGWIEKTIFENIEWKKNHIIIPTNEIEITPENENIISYFQTEINGSISKKKHVYNSISDSIFISQIDTLTENNIWTPALKTELKINTKNGVEEYVYYKTIGNEFFEIKRKDMKLVFDEKTTQLITKIVKIIEPNKTDQITKYEYDGFIPCPCIKIK